MHNVSTAKVKKHLKLISPPLQINLNAIGILNRSDFIKECVLAVSAAAPRDFLLIFR